MAEDVGARLRYLREYQGLSQRELARRAGVTNGTISMIESGRTSPQIASLKKILDVFPISIAEFFTIDLINANKTFYGIEELVEIGREGVSLRLVAGDKPDRLIQLCHERFEPGADTGEEMLIHEGDEAGLVIRGRLEVTVGDRQRVLGSGEAYYFSSRIPHRFRNVANEECIVVSAATPPTF